MSLVKEKENVLLAAISRHVSIPVKHSKLGATIINKVCPKTVQNALKWPLQKVDFQKFSGRACPRTLWRLFLFFNLLQLNSAGKKTLEKISKFWCLFREKISDYISDITQFQKAYLRPFRRLDVYRFCIYSNKHST